MANVIKLKKGLDIKLQGKAAEERMSLKSSGKFALVPDDFVGVVPKVVVKEGDMVKAGEALFVNKQYPEMKFASPVSGRVTAVERGERRKVLCVKHQPAALCCRYSSRPAENHLRVGAEGQAPGLRL